MDEQKKVRRTRGPGKRPALRHITLRVPGEVYDYFGGTTVGVRDALIAYKEQLTTEE